MSAIAARFTYGGTTPAADANTYVLFNSVTAGFGGGMMQGSGIKRLLLDLKNFYAGTLRQSESVDHGATWVEIDEQSLGTGSLTTSARRDFLVESYKDYKLEWINGGAAQTTGGVDWTVTMSLSTERASAGVKSGSSSAVGETTDSLDPGQNLALTTASTVYQFASAVSPNGRVLVSAPLANTAAINIGYLNTVTAGSTGKGAELQPGDREYFLASNANKLFVVSGTASQNVHALAC